MEFFYWAKEFGSHAVIFMSHKYFGNSELNSPCGCFFITKKYCFGVSIKPAIRGFSFRFMLIKWHVVFIFRRQDASINRKKKRYPCDWSNRSRFVRFFRAKNKCEWCGARNYEPHPVTGSRVVLTTAHVYDHAPESCSLLNLAALCQKCHNGHDAKMRRKRVNVEQMEFF